MSSGTEKDLGGSYRYRTGLWKEESREPERKRSVTGREGGYRRTDCVRGCRRVKRGRNQEAGEEVTAAGSNNETADGGVGVALQMVSLDRDGSTCVRRGEAFKQ